MSGLSMDDFLKDTKSSGSSEHFNLKKEGKVIAFLHPKSGIYKRNTHWFPIYIPVEEGEGKKKKTVNKVVNTMIVCPGTDKCAICIMRKALRDNGSIDNDETILSVGEGKEKTLYNKGEIIGAQGYGWEKNLAWKTEYLFGIVNKDKPESVQPLIAPKSLGKKITKVIEDQIEEEGEEEGNPFKNPYAFKLTYDKDADTPGDTYSAVWNKAEATEEIQELLDGAGPDLKPLVEKTSIEKISYIVREALEYDADELGLDLSAADDFDPEDLIFKKDNDDSDKGKDKTAKGPKKSSKEEDDEDEKPTKKPDKKPTSKTEKKPVAKPKKKQVECPECEEMIDEDASQCPHCDTEFETVEMIECPECQEEIPADSVTCSECGSDVQPF